MVSDYAQARRELWRLSLSSRILVLRQAARRFLDLLQFGSGAIERFIAALVLSAVFLLVFLGIAAATQQPTNLVLLFCAIAFVTSLLTSMLFILGPHDDDLKSIQMRTENDLGIKRQQVAALRSDAAALKVKESVRRDVEIAQRIAENSPTQATRNVQIAERQTPQKLRSTRICPYCREPIDRSAVKCPNCLEYLDPDLARMNAAPAQPQSNPGVAAVLSFLIPGLGQIYKRHVLSGLFWFVVIYTGCFVSLLLIPVCGIGLLGLPFVIMLYLICIFDAASSR